MKHKKKKYTVQRNQMRYVIHLKILPEYSIILVRLCWRVMLLNASESDRVLPGDYLFSNE